MKGLLINVTALKAVALAAADKDVRYYLNSVYVEWTPKGYRLTATDGKMQLVYREQFEEADEERGTGSVIVPLEAVKRVKVHRNIISVVFGEYTAEGGKRCVEFGAPMATQVIAEAIDATFPDYRRVIPAKCNGKVAQYDAALLFRFHQAAGLLSKTPYVTLAHNGEGPALVGIGDSDYIGIVMPFRGEVPTLPEWAGVPKRAKAQPAIVQPEQAAA